MKDDELIMRKSSAALCALIAALLASSGAPARIAPAHTQTALAAIENARKLAALGRGGLLLVGDALSTEQAPSENVIVVLESPVIKDMRPDTVLMVARIDCEPVESCLLARRVSTIDADGAVQTDPYTITGLLFAEVKVTLLGSVAYAIDLDTGTIRDMRAGHHQEPVTLSQAIMREQARRRGSRRTPL
jgi:hypothetical protein